MPIYSCVFAQAHLSPPDTTSHQAPGRKATIRHFRDALHSNTFNKLQIIAEKRPVDLTIDQMSKTVQAVVIHFISGLKAND